MRKRKQNPSPLRICACNGFAPGRQPVNTACARIDAAGRVHYMLQRYILSAGLSCWRARENEMAPELETRASTTAVSSFSSTAAPPCRLCLASCQSDPNLQPLARRLVASAHVSQFYLSVGMGIGSARAVSAMLGCGLQADRPWRSEKTWGSKPLEPSNDHLDSSFVRPGTTKSRHEATST